MTIAQSKSTERRYARTATAAEYTGLSVSFLNKARIAGGGPPFILVGTAVLYDLDVVDEWLAARTCTSTTNRNPGAGRKMASAK